MPAGLSDKQRYRIEYRILKRLAADYRSDGVDARYANRRVHTSHGEYYIKWIHHNTIAIVSWDSRSKQDTA
jgi:hypothetical protein